MAKRTLHLLTHYLVQRPGSLQMQVELGLVRRINPEDNRVFAGFLISAGSEQMDYRKRAIIHATYGNRGGIIAAVNRKGDLYLFDNETDILIAMAENPAPAGTVPPGEVTLSFQLVPMGDEYNIILTSGTGKGETVYNRLELSVSGSEIGGGNLALLASGGEYKFRNWQVRGTKVRHEPGQHLGPVIGTQYTLSNGILKLSAQMAPVSESEPPVVELHLKDPLSGRWNTVATSQIMKPGYTALFMLDSWNSSQSQDYRISYPVLDKRSRRIPVYYQGTIARDPVDKEEIVAAAFSGNCSSQGSMESGDCNFENIWFPHEDLVSHVAKQGPDLLIYTGDNVYENRPTPPDLSNDYNTILDYLYKWYMFLWAHGDLTRRIPSIMIPGEHDVYQGNLWGADGIAGPVEPKNDIYPGWYDGSEEQWQQDQGGYRLGPELVNMIERTQTSHLPDPYDPTPVAQGIGVYFCKIDFGRIGWAVLESNKFKSPPSKLFPQYRIVNGLPRLRGIDGRLLDTPDAILLGERQLDFIRHWTADWTGVDMKAAISHSIFAGLSTLPDTFRTVSGMPVLDGSRSRGMIQEGHMVTRDMGLNGWPKNGRDRALRELRKGFVTMIGGDRHPGSVVHHGIDEWEDAGYSFCVPPIASPFPRGWFPQSPGSDRKEGKPEYTGRYLDGFGNRMTVHAVSNPSASGNGPAILNDMAPGYGIIKFNKSKRTITFESWPGHIDPEAFDAEQFPGWPVIIHMEDNHSGERVEWLPPLRTRGLARPPVVQVVDEVTGEIIYTLRCTGNSYQPGIFQHGTYSVNIGEPGTSKMETIGGLVSSGLKDQQEILINF